MGSWSYKPQTIDIYAQTKHAERMILLSSSQIYSRTYLEYAGAEKQTAEKVGFRHLLSFFLFSHTKLLTSIAYKLKQLLS